MTDHVARIEAGLIPFVMCHHAGKVEWTPAHFQIGRITNLISCVVCLSTYDEPDISWLTAKEASEAHGWQVVSSVPHFDTSEAPTSR